MQRKMVLIDALNLYSQGGNGLLKYLIKKLQENKITYELLLGENLTNHQNKYLVFYRKKIILSSVRRFSPHCILCFGNFPPHFSLPDSITVIVNFQNAFLLNNCDVSAFNFLERFKFAIRRLYLRTFLKYADLYVFPTAYIQDKFIESYAITPQKCRTIPYFDRAEIEKVSAETEQKQKIKNSFAYISSSSKHKNHMVLLKAWELLADKNIFPLLTLSIISDNFRSGKILNYISYLKSKNVKIENINKEGFLPYEEVLRKSAIHEFSIYPSLNETFGFGTIEGAILGNKLLVSNRSFVKDVTVPSLTFNPLNARDIAEKVVFAMNNQLPDTQLVFEDRVDEFIKLLINTNT